MTDNTFSLISKLQCKISEMLSEEMEKIGLKGFCPSYGKIFLTLKKGEPISMKTLSTLIDKKPQTVTTLISNLEKQGFVTIKACAQDKRTKYVQITEKGLQLIPELERISEELYKKQYLNFATGEREAMRVALEKMIKNFDG